MENFHTSSGDLSSKFALMDGAVGEIDEFTQQIESSHKITADTTKSLIERLSSYEDIIDSEVGDTDLVRAKSLF